MPHSYWSNELAAGLAAQFWFERNDLNGGILNFTQKPVQDRAAQENLPAGTHRLAEHDMRDSFPLREVDERVSYFVALQLYNSGPQVFSQLQILGKIGMVLRTDMPRL